MSSTFMFFFLMFTWVTGEPVTGSVSEMVKQAARVKQSKESQEAIAECDSSFLSV